MKAEKRMAIVQLQCMVKYNILFENEIWQPLWQLLRALWQLLCTFPIFVSCKEGWLKKNKQKNQKTKTKSHVQRRKCKSHIQNMINILGVLVFLIYIWNQKDTLDLRDE